MPMFTIDELQDLLINHDDLGEYLWPPTYSSRTPTIVSFSFPVSLIVAQFTIFGSFRVLNFRSRFEALNDVFFGIEWSGKYESMLDSLFAIYGCSP